MYNEKLDKIILNQQILWLNQQLIISLLLTLLDKLPSDEKELLLNYVADLLETATLTGFRGHAE